MSFFHQRLLGLAQFGKSSQVVRPGGVVHRVDQVVDVAVDDGANVLS
jgi:hypothetical protein